MGGINNDYLLCNQCDRGRGSDPCARGAATGLQPVAHFRSKRFFCRGFFQFLLMHRDRSHCDKASRWLPARLLVYNTIMLSIEESAALLHEIYPGYPDMRNSRPAPTDLETWLQAYRQKA